MQAQRSAGFDPPAGVIEAACAIVAAHPDDETLAAAAVLQRARSCFVLHVTDGAPHDAGLRSCAPERSRKAYAQSRQQELNAALGLARIGPERVRWLGAVDQEACFALCELVQRLVAELLALRPEVVIAHPYEGGHPDHDAACFVAHAALRVLQQRGAPVPSLYEMASYHAAHGQLLAGEFIAVADASEFALALSPPEQMCKREMLACFSSQREVFATLGRSPDVERFRRAIAADFSCPPHAGTTYYETLGWPLSAQRFCQLACAASRALGVGGLGWD